MNKGNCKTFSESGCLLKPFVRKITVENFAFLWILIGVMLSSVSCAGSYRNTLNEIPPDSSKTIYVVEQGWHTGIVILKAAIPDSLLPERDHFPGSAYLEFGWGDRDFYQNPQFNLFQAFKALFWPTATVVHVRGIRQPPEAYYVTSGLIRIKVSDRGFVQLCQFLHKSFARDTSRGSPVIGPGVYGNSLFFKGSSHYYFPKTCNVWTAEALTTAGLDFNPWLYQSARSVMNRTGRFGEVIRETDDD